LKIRHCPTLQRVPPPTTSGNRRNVWSTAATIEEGARDRRGADAVGYQVDGRIGGCAVLFTSPRGLHLEALLVCRTAPNRKYTSLQTWTAFNARLRREIEL